MSEKSYNTYGEAGEITGFITQEAIDELLTSKASSMLWKVSYEELRERYLNVKKDNDRLQIEVVKIFEQAQLLLEKCHFLEEHLKNTYGVTVVWR